MKFDRALFSIKSSTRFKWAITFDARYFRGKPSEKIDSYSPEKERSLEKEKKLSVAFEEKKMIIAFKLLLVSRFL